MVGAWVFLYRVKCLSTRSSAGFFKKIFSLIEGWLLYDIVMASATHRSQAYMWPLPPLSPLPTPSPPPPTRLSRSTTFGSPRYTSIAHWLSLLHMVIYMFQCYSLKSSHPLLLPLCSKVGSLCLCLLRCPAHRIIGTILLDSIYMY